MPNPFKKIVNNTVASEQAYKKGAKTTSKITTRVCASCAAPRPANTNLTSCDYCGFVFMDIEAEISADNDRQ